MNQSNIDISILDPDQIREVVAIGNEQGINEDMIRLPSNVAYYGGKYAEAKGVQAQRKREMEVVEAQLYLEYKGATMANGKPATEEYVRSSITLDPRLQAVARVVDENATLLARIGAVCDAIAAKREMLISLGANYRAERQPGPSINETPLSAQRRRLQADPALDEV